MKTFFMLGWLAVSAIPCFAQSADVFVKGDSYQCWLDAREIAHRRSSLVTEDEKNRVIHAGHFASMGGDFTIAIQVIPDKNKKGEEGCRVYVALEGGGSLSERELRANARNGSFNFRVASSISAELESMKKAREKKAKKQ